MGKGYLPPWLLQALGILILIGAVIYWAVSGHESALIIGAALALIGLGAYSGIRIIVHQEIDEAKERESTAMRDSLKEGSHTHEL